MLATSNKKEISREIICAPGQRLCLSNKHTESGYGTYVRQGYIYSSLVGFLQMKTKTIEAEDSEETITVLEVRSGKEQTVVPSLGDIVTCKVNSMTCNLCRVSILCIGSSVLAESFKGVIRKEDIRATEKDKTEMYKSFRPMDIVLAKVISIGDADSYLLSTAEDELGVVIAHSEAGVVMVPVSWTEMQCPKTYEKQHRKVARVVAELPST